MHTAFGSHVVVATLVNLGGRRTRNPVDKGLQNELFLGKSGVHVLEVIGGIRVVVDAGIAVRQRGGVAPPFDEEGQLSINDRTTSRSVKKTSKTLEEGEGAEKNLHGRCWSECWQ